MLATFLLKLERPNFLKTIAHDRPAFRKLSQ
jgi:hypothetical protein